MWTEPTQRDGKPSLEFTRFVHTPVAESEQKGIRTWDIEADVPLREQIDLLLLYLPGLHSAINGAKFKKKNEGYVSMITDAKVPGKYLFDLSEIKQAVVIGRYPKPEELPPTLRKRIFNEG